MKKLAVLMAILSLSLFGLVGCKRLDKNYNSNVKNVIVLIGDGMGANHVENAEKFFNEDFEFTDDYFCNVTTKSLNSSVTDSAAAATALATGTKVNNGEVSYHDGENIENLMEIARKNNKKTAVVTSDDLFGATPACYSSHADSRSNTDAIIKGQIESNIDLFVGPNSKEYSKENYGKDFEEKGYKLLSTEEELDGLEKDEKALVTLSSLRSIYNENLTGQVDYKKVVSDVLDYLDNESGFCVMIENAYIDKCSHNNDFYGAMCEVKEFNDMIKAVYEFCTGRDDTAVIITADHETGGLQLGNKASDFSDSLYTSGGHTGANVNLYLKYAYLDKKKTIDNTDIFKLCKSIIDKSGSVAAFFIGNVLSKN